MSNYNNIVRTYSKDTGNVELSFSTPFYNWEESIGQIYLKSSYPRLYEKVGLYKDIPDDYAFNNWTNIPIGVVTVNGILINTDLYIFVAHGGILRTSTNAINWTDRISGTSSNISTIVYGNDLYVYGGQKGVLSTSTNAINWTARTSGTSSNINSLAYADSLYLYAGVDGVLGTSTDAINWTARASGTSTAINTIVYGNGLYVYGGINGVLSTSTDAINWTARTSGTTSNINNIIYNEGLYIYGGGDLSSSTLGTSTNAINWTTMTSIGGVNRTITSISYNDGTYIVSCEFGNLITSTDAINWTARTSGTTSNINVIYSYNGIFLYGGVSVLRYTTLHSYDSINEFYLPEDLIYVLDVPTKIFIKGE